MQSDPKSDVTASVADYLKSLGYEYLETQYRHSEPNRAPVYLDIVVFDAKHAPRIVVEVKSELPAELNNFHPAVDRPYGFARQLNAPYFLVSDGIRFFWYKIGQDKSGFEPLGEPPEYQSDEGFILQRLGPEEDMRPLFGVIDILRSKAGREDYSELLFALLLSKVFDERHEPDSSTLQFQVFSGESADETRDRISQLYRDAVHSQKLPFDDDIIKRADSSAVQKVVKQLQPFRLSGTDAIERLIEHEGTNPRYGGGFFTPAAIANLISGLFDFSPQDSVLDPALGTGGFLASIAHESLESKFGDTPRLVGVERDKAAIMQAAARLSALGMLKNTKLLWADFLLESTQQKLRRSVSGGFDYVLSNPPFGMKAGPSYEASYLDAILDNLKFAGYAAVILPDGILFGSRFRQDRASLLTRARVGIVISLPVGAFRPLTSIQTSILILSRADDSSSPAPTLFLRIPDRKDTDEVYAMAAETSRHFLKTKKLLKASSIQLSPTLGQIDAENGYRMDYSAFAPEYFQVIDKLSRSDIPLVALGDVADVRLGSYVREKRPEGVQVVSASDLRNDWFSREDEEPPWSQTSMLGHEEELLRPGDLLVPSIIGQDSPVFLVPDSNRLAVASRALVVIRPDQQRIVPTYLFALFRNKLVRVQLQRLSIGTTIRTVTPKLLREIQIPILPFEKQRVIGHLIAQYQQATTTANFMLHRADADLGTLFDLEDKEAEDEIA
jgi:predicted RNA methylase